jgi:hypothetical protein
MSTTGMFPLIEPSNASGDSVDMLPHVTWNAEVSARSVTEYQ